MIEAQRHRQEQAGTQLALDVAGLLPPPGHAQNRHLRPVDNRCNAGQPHPAQIGEGETRALEVVHPQPVLTGLAGQFGQLLGNLEQTLPRHIPQHRHEQPPFRVHRHADVNVLAQDDLVFLSVQYRIEKGKLGQRTCQCSDQNRGEGQGPALLGHPRFVALAGRFQFGDVRLFLQPGVGNLAPGPLHIGRGHLADAAEGLALDRAKGGDVGQGRVRERHRFTCRGTSDNQTAGVGLHILAADAPAIAVALHIADVDAQFPGHPPRDRAGRDDSFLRVRKRGNLSGRDRLGRRGNRWRRHCVCFCNRRICYRC